MNIEPRMSSKPDGGPAFPFEFDDQQTAGPSPTIVHPGMSLRDYFAAQVLAGSDIVDSQAYCDVIAGRNSSRIRERAKVAYALADAMLEARK